MIIHLINNCAWLLYHKMIPLSIVCDITCHRSGFHSCVWALYPNLYIVFTGVTVFAIFAGFVKIVALVGTLLTSSSTAFHWLSEFSNSSQILQHSQFSQFSQKSHFSSGPSQPILLQDFSELTNFPIFCRFCNIRNFHSFRKNRSSRRGPLNPSSTGFHWLDESSKFSQILQFSQFLQFLQKSQFSWGPSQPILTQVFTDLTNFPIVRIFYNIRNFRSFRKNHSPCRGPLNLLFYWFSLTWPIFQFIVNLAVFAAACKPGHISNLTATYWKLLSVKSLINDTSYHSNQREPDYPSYCPRRDFA